LLAKPKQLQKNFKGTGLKPGHYKSKKTDSVEQPAG
jgi:hypothetical protein